MVMLCNVIPFIVMDYEWTHWPLGDVAEILEFSSKFNY